MATTSTIPTVKALLVTKFTSALATASHMGGQVPVTYAWPGPNTAHEAVFLGRHPELDDIRLDASHDIPTIKAGRKHRQESYDLEFTVWTFRPDLTVGAAATCEARAFELLGHLEDEMADDPTLGSTAVQQVTVDRFASTLFPFQKGWACELLVTVSVRARLT